ncbi:hypothetical protein, partial [Streptomyces ipomoeae]|uniref:hypothetical protein n=1 Tax=Streptomyces ipomoeae TaxID=103232 RepID=UPI0029BA4460
MTSRIRPAAAVQRIPYGAQFSYAPTARRCSSATHRAAWNASALTSSPANAPRIPATPEALALLL